MNKRKRKAFLPLLFAAGCFLVACSTDKIIARPDWIDYEIINDPNDVLKDNKLKRIYDAVKKLSDTNPNLLTKLLYKIGEKQLGSFLQNDEKNPGIETFGSSEYDPASGSFDEEHRQKLKAFIDAHPFYKSSEKGVKRVNPDTSEKVVEDLKGDDSLKVSYELIKDRRTRILNSIFEKLFNEINGGSYSVDNRFYEEKFLRSLRKQMYVVDSIDGNEGIIAKYEEVTYPKEFTPRRVDGEDQYGRHQLLSWAKYVNDDGPSGQDGFLHVFSNLDNLTYYEDSQDQSKPSCNMYKDYINRKILPEIYRDTLAQIYVKDQNYSSLGRTYARKIHMVSVPTSDATVSNVYNLFHEYAKNMNGTDTYTFDIINTAMRGILNSADVAINLLDTSGFKPIEVEDLTTDDPKDKKQLQWKLHRVENDNRVTPVYKGTLLGDLVEKYMKVFNVTYKKDEQGTSYFDFETFNPTRDEDFYKELTGNYSYSVEHGLELKEREIALTNYIKDGWYLKNEGAEDLGDVFKKRLFDISTSKIIDVKSRDDYKDGDYARQLGNKKYYLTNEDYTDEEKSIVLKEDGKIHIVEIEEAPSTSKLSTDINNEGSYVWDKLDIETSTLHRIPDDNLTWSTSFRDNIVNDVVAKVSSGDTYKKNAEEYFLMISNIIFYDEDVYDYFKSQYPDLF
ncbi:MAG: hypothetical protein MJ206_02535 [Bacilli bacterium]|nr:hypothetical protein [Bacilli bacterium]